MGGVAAVVSIFSAVQSYQAAQDQADAQEKAAARAEELSVMNAASAEAEAAESKRRTQQQQVASEAGARAKAAASGTVGGSMQDSIAAMMSEHGRQLDWMDRSSKSQQDIILAGGKDAAATGRAQASATRASGTTNLLRDSQTVYTSGKKAGWWDKPTKVT